MKYVTPKQAAKIMGVGVDHVLNLIHEEKLRASNVGSGQKLPRWKISTDDIKRFMDGRVKSSIKVSRRRSHRRPANYVEYV